MRRVCREHGGGGVGRAGHGGDQGGDKIVVMEHAATGLGRRPAGAEMVLGPDRGGPGAARL
jgi:hypothetical protein